MIDYQPILSAAKTDRADVTQLWIIHQLSPAWLVSLQDLSAGIVVQGFLRCGSSQEELARHAFQDLEVPRYTSHITEHQSFKRLSKKEQ